MLWTKEEVDELKIRYKETNNTELSKIFGRSAESVKKKGLRLGLHKSKNCRRKYTVDDSFFANPNILNSYVAGFILADGYIRNNKSFVTIKLAQKDCDYLKKIKSLVNFNGPVHEYTHGGFPYCMFTINSTNWLYDLDKNFNISYDTKINKNMNPPKLNYTNSLAFINGVIDGDGCISIIKNIYPEVHIIGNKEILEWVSIFSKQFTKSKGKNFYKTKFDKLYNFKLNRLKCVAFCKEILSVKELNGIRMDRKWSKMEKWM